jgi:cell shape-determining protein MreD
MLRPWPAGQILIQEFFLIFLLSLSVLKLSHKVCIVEAWVEGECQTDVPEGRGGAEVEAWRRL